MQTILDELLDRWEESSEKGYELTPEQLCVEHPELLEELRWRINALRAVDAQFGASIHKNGEYAANEAKTDKLNQTIQVESEFRIDRLHASLFSNRSHVTPNGCCKVPAITPIERRAISAI